MLKPDENEVITRTGPGTPMGEWFRRFWLPVMLAEEIPVPDSPPVRVRVLGENLIAFRDSEGKVGLLDRYCAHRRADLFFGRNEECGLRCVYHGWKYDVEGTCVDMPSEPPESNFKEKIKLKAYPCQERAGLIWAYLGPSELKPEMPQLEWTRVPDSHCYIAKAFLEANWLQHLEGDLDSVHTRFLHSFQSADALRKNMLMAEPSRLAGSSFDYRWQGESFLRVSTNDTEYGFMVGFKKSATEESYFWHVNHWLMPAYSMVAGGGPGQTFRSNLRIPVDEEHTMTFRIRWNPDRPLTDSELNEYRFGSSFEQASPQPYFPKRNMENDFLIDRELQRSWNYTGIVGNPAQDQAVNCSMGAITDRSQEHLGTSDTAIIALRRRLLTAVRDLQEGKGPYAAYHGEVYKVRPGDVMRKKDEPFDDEITKLIAAKI
jgi:phthalate 4,5-dioxygenase oxygenase subunit